MNSSVCQPVRRVELCEMRTLTRNTHTTRTTNYSQSARSQTRSVANNNAGAAAAADSERAVEGRKRAVQHQHLAHEAAGRVGAQLRVRCGVDAAAVVERALV